MNNYEQAINTYKYSEKERINLIQKKESSPSIYAFKAYQAVSLDDVKNSISAKLAIF